MKRLLVWYGELITPRRLRRRGFALLAPGLLWLLVFLALPAAALVATGFASRGAYGEIEWKFTLENFSRVFGYGRLGWSADHLRILTHSVAVALATTAAAVALAYPLAFFIADRPPRRRYFWLTLLAVPFWTNVVIRTYAWFLILAPELPFARFAAFLGLIEAGAPLYPGPLAVMLGMVSIFLPFAALPLYASVEHLDWGLVEAARDLYASRMRVFTQAILPQTLPGLAVAIVLTFIPAMGMFVVPDLLGGAKTMLVGNLIQQQFGTSRDWPFGAAASLALMVLTLIGLKFCRRRGPRETTDL